MRGISSGRYPLPTTPVSTITRKPATPPEPSRDDTTITGLMTPTPHDAERMRRIILPALKTQHETGAVDDDAIDAAINEADPPGEGVREGDVWGNIVDIHRTATPSGKPYGYRREVEFALSRTWWDVWVAPPAATNEDE